GKVVFRRLRYAVFDIGRVTGGDCILGLDDRLPGRREASCVGVITRGGDKKYVAGAYREGQAIAGADSRHIHNDASRFCGSSQLKNDLAVRPERVTGHGAYTN